MGRGAEQDLVPAARGLALGAVGHGHLPAACAGHGRQLAVHREGRAAAASQAGRLDVRDQRTGRPAIGNRAEAGQVTAEVFGPGREQAGQVRARHEPPEVTWPLPDPAVGGELGLKPPDPEELGAGLEPVPDEPELDGAGFGPDERMRGLAACRPRAGAAVPVLWAAPGAVTARAPAATTLATATVVVIELTLARARSLAATAWRISS